MTDEQFAAWPKCAVPACHNKCCLRLRSKYCWPHTRGDAGEAANNLRETELVAAGVAAPHPNLPTDHKSAPIQKRDKPKPDAGVPAFDPAHAPQSPPMEEKESLERAIAERRGGKV